MPTMNKSVLLRSAAAIATGVLLPSLAYAHTGDHSGGFIHGLAHPASGLDHLCAMLAVGLWAAQTGGRSLWAVPLTFAGVMALGGALPALGIGLPFVEQGILLSVLLLGVLVAASARLPLWLASSMAGLFALWHGYAHGAETPAWASGMSYAAGFVLATLLLHAAGIAFVLGMHRQGAWQRACRQFVRLAGSVIALCGVYLAVA